MQALILIGQKRDPEKGLSVECLYAGLDGQALEAAAAKAAASKAYSRIERLTNPQGTPMAIDPTPMKSTGKPKQIERKAVAAPKISKATPHIENMESDLARQRRGRFTLPEIISGQKPLDPKTPAPPRTDGPTIKEFVAGGQPKEAYPPVGFAAKPEPFDQAKVDVMIALADKAKADKAEADKPKLPPARPSGPPARIVETQATQVAPVDEAQQQTATEGNTNESVQQ